MLVDEEKLDVIAGLISTGRPDLAVREAVELRRRFPAAVEPVRLHGVALLSLGRVDEAISVLQEASALDPQSVETLCNLGSALLARNDGRAALTVMNAARILAADHPAVLNGLGNARRAVGDHSGARDAYASACRVAPAFLAGWLNLAAAELALGQFAVCERIARMILRQTSNASASLLLAQSLTALNRLDEAAAVCAEALGHAPDDARLHYQHGQIADDLGKPSLALQSHARAWALDPALSGALAQRVFIQRQLCDWRDLDALSLGLRRAVSDGAADVAPFGFLAEPAGPGEQLACARQFASALARRLNPQEVASPFTHARQALDAPLRIGFASNGFGNHPTGLLSVAFFEALGARGVEVQLFATAPADGSSVQHRLRAAAHHWHDLHGLGAPLMAERIAHSGVEILIDLRVWGGGNISEALSLRPAPVQVNWLAFPGSSGADWIDYVVADRVALPASLREHYSERVAWLPRCFQPSDPTRRVDEPPPRSACGLPANGTVYVCFNNSYKLDPRSLGRMLAILRAVPDSILWLLAGPGDSQRNLCAAAQGDGVDPSRLVFMSKLPHAEYLSRYRHADLFLDTAIYNAHTTASDAIWAGCPVLTTPGDTFASRVAASLNHHLGMPELNVPDDAAYIEFAVRIGSDRGARDALHQRLFECRAISPLFDMRGFADDFRALLMDIAQRHRRGLPVAAID
jgi:predicted O-linked N-acetylglucosamine transferase (SPINDLY family)